MTEIQRKREIAKWLLVGAHDIETGRTRAKTPENAARPYMRGAFTNVPTRREVDEVATIISELIDHV